MPMRGRAIVNRVRQVLERVAAASLLATLGYPVAAAPSGEPIEPLPLVVPLDAPQVALGERLFADPQLSRDRLRACTSCHPLGAGGMDGQVRPQGANGQRLRNTPTIFNVGFNLFLNWDGATERLQPHDEKVILSPALMATTWPELLGRVRGDPSYAPLFAALATPGVSRENVLDALAAYERSLVTPNSRFDRYLRGERSALTPEELQGYELFKSYGCIACHQGINIGGNVVQRFGVFADPGRVPATGETPDLGRSKVTGRPRDHGVFRVPSLRNVAITAPYFHDGSAATLESAVYTMARVQLGRELGPDQIGQIVAFLGTLTGEYQGTPLRSPPRSEP